MANRRTSSSPDKQPKTMDTFISAAMRGICSSIKPEELPGLVYDLRQKLIEALISGTPPKDIEHEIFLRDTLPPLQVEPGPLRPAFSPWRASANALCGLLFGAAVAQAMQQAAGALTVFCALLGMALSLWLAEIVAEKAAGYQAKIGRWTIKKVLVWGRRGWLALLAVALLRDFVQGRDLLGNFVLPLHDFFNSGFVLGIFNNLYWTLLIVAVWFIAAIRPAGLDRGEFEERLRHSCRHWWTGAEKLAKLIDEKTIAAPAENKTALAAFSQELASFAAELDPARRAWLEDRLDTLGFGSAKSAATMNWSRSLRDTFEPVGHLTEGDLCFVDIPPLYDDGRMIRKGTVRKVRL